MCYDFGKYTGKHGRVSTEHWENNILDILVVRKYLYNAKIQCSTTDNYRQRYTVRIRYGCQDQTFLPMDIR